VGKILSFSLSTFSNPGIFPLLSALPLRSLRLRGENELLIIVLHILLFNYHYSLHFYYGGYQG
jgi:hypothetical protein